ncbi:MAG: YcaO-like family protein, partial [Candidatus Brocadiaceae bacterium]|nr:YcaO-like family protein [Candidatus Brocadiaceae bacterium]
FQSIRPAATNLVVDSGKGETRDEALVATMAEAIERYCGENCLNERIALKDIDSIENLVFYPSLPFRRPLDDYLEVTVVKRYPDMKAFYTPFELISYANTNPRKELSRYPWGTTGLGAHTSTENAVLSGLLEVMERDAISSMFFGTGDISFRRVDVRYIPEELQVLAAKIVEFPYELIIIEICTRFGMSVFAVYHTDKFLYPGGIGYGTHPCRSIGLKHALLEAAQSRVLRIAGSRDDLRFLIDDSYKLDSLFSLTPEQFDDSSGDKIEHLSDEDVLLFCVEKLKAIDIDIYFSELIIEPSPPLTVVKVIAPGLKLLRQGTAMTGIPLAPSMEIFA